MAMQKEARMIGELFQAWLEHFKTAIMDDMGLESRHLLILDGHGSHVSLEVVGKAHEAGIDIVTLPAHTSHKLQPWTSLCLSHSRPIFERRGQFGNKKQPVHKQARVDSHQLQPGL
ncbi:hypothetical protein L7F22_063956 [Adiantum nelumboides]|nr:hypothetical protein [Adiantum nelumboides]